MLTLKEIKMKCVCGSERIARISGKTSDCCAFWYGDMDYDGYVPSGVGVGEGGDLIEFSYCLDCGRIQDKFPISDERIKKELDLEESQ